MQYPFFNEPGYERQLGTPEGERNARYGHNGGYDRLRVGTLQWAIAAQLASPSPGFEDAIKEHFKLKKDHILKTMEKWTEEAKDSTDSSHRRLLGAQVAKVKAALKSLK